MKAPSSSETNETARESRNERVSLDQENETMAAISNASTNAAANVINKRSLNKSLTVNDVVGSSSRPSEQEMETRVLRSVEGIDLNAALNAGQQQQQLSQNPEEEEVVRLMSDIVRTSLRNHQPPPLSDKSAIEFQAEKRRKHRKKESVDQELFGLTAALAQMGPGMKNSSQGQEYPGQSSHTTSSSSVASPRLFSDTTSERLTQTAHVVVGTANTAVQEQQAQNTAKGDIEAQPPRGSTDGSDTSGANFLSAHKNRDKGDNHRGHGRFQHKKFSYFSEDVKEEMESNWNVFNEFVSSRKSSATRFCRKLFFFVMLPSLGMAFLLYYVFDNPIARDTRDKININTNATGISPIAGGNLEKEYASFSWWFLFLGVRQPVTFAMAVATQAIVIDFLVFRTRIFMKWFAPFFTLWLVQSKGWPFLITVWGAYNFALNAGDRDYTDNWLYWQDWLGIFNQNNPNGDVPSGPLNYTVIATFVWVGILVSFKRVVVSLFLGRQSFAHFGEQLIEIMKHVVMIGLIAALARSIEKTKTKKTSPKPKHAMDDDTWVEAKKLQDLMEAEEVNAKGEGADDKGSELDGPNPAAAANAFITHRTTVNNNKDSTTGKSNLSRSQEGSSFSKSEKMKLSELLDAWEEPQTAEEKPENKITIGSVLQFRQALTLMSAKYPFTPAFGIADTRATCIESAQEVYARLMLRTPALEDLPFETLALVAKGKEGGFDDEQVKELIRVFRPDRDGKLDELDFVKSIDKVYKSIRLLSANISNSRHTDAAVESIVNAVFWFFVGSIILGQLGVDPMQLLVSISSLVIAFAFMFGGSAAKYFEGLLFILLQRPYGVGDRIHLSSPQNDTNIDGSSGWIVEKLSLYTTTLYWGATNERATLANGAISNLRVINAARSPNAQIYVNMMFAIDTPYETIETFRSAVEQFLKDRPREFLAFNGFRPTEVAVDRGFINYVIIAQHRNSWQDIGGILSSKAELIKFCLEVAKRLGMNYSSPPLPVSLTIEQSPQPGEISPQDIAALKAFSKK